VKRRLRVRRRADFQAAITGRRFYSGRAFVAFATPASSGHDRVGVTVSRGVKSSVERNRIRRRLREAARQNLLTDSGAARLGIRYDVILIARPAALTVSFADLKAEAEQAALRLSNLDS
jgi:ribonuclease P protein component